MKIDIIGAVGSGKTTLSRRIAEEFHIPCYEQDNIVWMRTRDGDIMRPSKERERMFMDILTSKNWVMEGSPRKYLKERYKHCDYIIFLDTNSFIRLYRILRRWIRQKTGKESYNTKPTLKFLWMNIRWHHEFNKDRKQLISELLQCGLRYKSFKNANDVINFCYNTYEINNIKS